MARVVKVAADGDAEDRAALDEPRDRTRRRDADRVGEDDLAGSGGDEPLGEVGNDARVDLALEGAAEGDADRRGRGPVGAARIRSTRSVASASVAFPLRRLNSSVAASVTLTRPSGVADEPLPAALVEDEPGELGVDLARPSRRPLPRPPSAARAPG